jgi:SAM-dependent methyltransferase
VLDVGCGAGALARELARRVEQVDALDRDPTMVALARTRAPANLTVLQGDALAVDLRPGGYDAVLSLSALHHLPLQPALERMAFAAGRALTGLSLFARQAGHAAMPVHDPELTTRQVRAAASEVLPGVRVRRLLLWRYLLSWTKPAH